MHTRTGRGVDLYKGNLMVGAMNRDDSGNTNAGGTFICHVHAYYHNIRFINVLYTPRAVHARRTLFTNCYRDVRPDRSHDDAHGVHLGPDGGAN